MGSIDEIKSILEVDIDLAKSMNSNSYCFRALESYLVAIDECLSVEKYDVENTHQLRINLRKVKTLLNSKPFIFEICDVEKIISALDDCFEIAGNARDIDTLIENYENYLSEVPESFKGESRLVLKALNYKGAQAKRAFTKYIKSNAASVIFDESLALIKKYHDTSFDYALKDIASDRVYNALNNIVAFLEEDVEFTEDRVHELRLLCKKFRYNLELFGDYSSLKKMKKILEKLRGLQDNLGFYNDLCVHIKILAPMAEKASVGEVALIASIATIIEALKSELFDVIEYEYKSLRKKDKLFGIKKKILKKY